MAKLDRVTQVPFGLDGSVSNFGQFGSLAAESIVTSKDPATIQSLQAWTLGWSAALVQVGNQPKIPAMQDMNGAFLVAFYQLAYLLQAGIAEWDAGTTYYENSFVQVNGTLYKSLTDDNVNNDPVTDATNWVSAPNSNIAGALYGGVPQNNAVDPTFRIDFSACQAKDSTGTYLIESAAMTKNVTAVWAAGSGQGGLDTGTIGSSAILVYFYQIGDSNGIEPGDFLFSKSASSPTLPTGYNLKRYLGARRWNGTSWDQFATAGNGVDRTVSLFSPPTILTAGVATVFTDVSVASYVDVNSCRLANISAVSSGVNANCQIFIRPKGSSLDTDANSFAYGRDSGGSAGAGATGEIALSSAGVFQYKGTSGASTTMYLRGYKESL